MRMRVLLAALLIAGVAPAVAAEAPDAANPPAGSATTMTPEMQKAARIDGLFEMLRTATDVGQGRAIERALMAQWLKSGDAGTDEVMHQVLVAMDSGDLQLAVKYLDAIIAARPDFMEAWNKRATVYFYLGAYDKSLADIARTLQLEPRHFGALAGLGMIRLKQGDKQGALDAFERAVAIDPQLEDIHVEIDLLKDQLGKGI